MLNEIIEIEEHCRECPFNDSGMKKGNKACVKCTHYKELRKLGKKLEGRDLTKTGSKRTSEIWHHCIPV